MIRVEWRRIKEDIRDWDRSRENRKEEKRKGKERRGERRRLERRIEQY